MDLVIFVMATLTALLAVSYSMMISRLDEIKENWAAYRCNPAYMPFASFVGVDTAGNFMRCTMKSFQDYAGFILDPIQRMFGTFLAMFSSIATSLESMRSMFAGVRNGFLGIVTMIFGKISNTLAAMKYLMVRIRTVFMRVVGVTAAMMQIMNAGISSGRSVINGPIGRTISFLCFAPETHVSLEDGSHKMMTNVMIGDVLEGGHTVTGTYVLFPTEEPLYDYRGVLVTGSHRLDNGMRVDEMADAVLTNDTPLVLSCLDTDTGYIQIGDVLFRDFEFESSTLTVKNSSTPLDASVVGLRKRSAGWEVLVR